MAAISPNRQHAGDSRATDFPAPGDAITTDFNACQYQAHHHIDSP